MNDQQLTKIAVNKAFPGIPESEAEKLILAGQVNKYAPGTCLCLEGNVEDTFYVILSGGVEVTKQINDTENRLLKKLYPGDFFGEMGLIHDAPRAATVITTSDVTVMEIDKLGFKEVLQESSTVSLAMVREVSRRLRENDEMAIEDLRLKAGELAEAYQQLAEHDLARREFLTTIAHELRTPLTSASGYLQMIQMGAMQGEDHKRALESVSNSVQRIIDLTNDILFLQEMDLIFSNFLPINLRDRIPNIIDDEKDHAGKMGVKVEFEVEESLPLIHGDLKSLDRAFRALLNNAIKFSLNGGVVEIRVTSTQEHVLVHIRDEGIGIRESDLAHIFDRFWRTEEYEGVLFDGIGLGLAIAKQVVKQHKGTIDIESEYKKGAEFIVTLPLLSGNE
jgi:signal transduction histidine kinase